MNWKQKLECIEVGDLIFYNIKKTQMYCVVNTIIKGPNPDMDQMYGNWQSNIAFALTKVKSITYMNRADCHIKRKGVK